jgi:DNA-binding LacI/PurR family transcriptional regulator
MNLASNRNPALWWPRAIFSLVDALGDAGVSVHLVSARTEVNWSSIGVDALITIERPGGHSVIPNSIPFGIPIFYGGDLTDDVPGVARIAPDYRAVATLGLDHLEDSGSRRPGLLSLAARVSFAEHLEQGYESWCASRGIEPLIVGRNGGAPALLVEELLAKGCDGILSLSNASAEILAGLTSIAQVPQECRLLVLSEGLVERHLSPRVSVLSLDGASAGRRVAARVIEALSTGRAEPIELSATLLIGETT